MANYSADLVQQAVLSLYRGENVSAVNDFLVGFTDSPSAWGVGLELLSSPEETIRFFAANTLLTKVKVEWEQLPEDSKRMAWATILGHTKNSVESGSATLVTKRLCLVLAAAAVLSGTAHCDVFLSEAMSHSATNAERSLGVNMLLAFGEQVGDVDRVRREEGRSAMLKMLPSVLSFLEFAIKADGVDGAVCATTIQAVKCWCAQTNCALHQVASHAGSLLTSVVELVSSGDGSVATASVEALQDLLCSSTIALSPQQRAVHDSSISGISQSVVAQSARLRESGGVGSDSELALVKVAVACAEPLVDRLIQGQDQHGLLELLLVASGSANLVTAETALGYWPLLNASDLPLAQRHEQLRPGGAFFLRLLEVVFQRAQYPVDFTSWEESELEEIDFQSFREQALAEVVEMIYCLLRGQFLSFLAPIIQDAAAQRWQAIEAVLYIVRVIVLSLKERIRSVKPEDVADSEASSTFLVALFSMFAEKGIVTHHPLVVESAARVIGTYAQWIERMAQKGHQQVLLAAVTCLMSAVGVPSAGKYIAHSLHSLCARCAQYLNVSPHREQLIDSCAVITQGMDLESSTLVTKGFSRIVCACPPSDATPLLQRLVTPIVARIQAATTNEALATDLSLLASAVQFIEFGPEQGVSGDTDSPVHPTLFVIQSCLAVLQSIASQWAAHEDVITALCEVFTRSLLSIKTLLPPELLGTVVSCVASVYSQSCTPACLECIAAAVEIYGKAGGVEQSFAQLFVGVCQRTSTLVSSSPDSFTQYPQVVRSLFELGHRCLLYCPPALLPQGGPFMLELAIAGLKQTPERDAARAILFFLNSLAGAGTTAPPPAPPPVSISSPSSAAPLRTKAPATPKPALGCESHVDTLWLSHGEALVNTLVVGVCDALPSSLWSHVADLLQALAVAFNAQAQSWLASALATLPAAGVNVTEEVRRTFGALVFMQPPLTRPRFRAMVADFANVCRGQNTPEVLMAYVM